MPACAQAATDYGRLPTVYRVIVPPTFGILSPQTREKNSALSLAADLSWQTEVPPTGLRFVIMEVGQVPLSRLTTQR
jgi:hypothetical protein